MILQVERLHRVRLRASTRIIITTISTSKTTTTIITTISTIIIMITNTITNMITSIIITSITIMIMNTMSTITTTATAATTTRTNIATSINQSQFPPSLQKLKRFQNKLYRKLNLSKQRLLPNLYQYNSDHLLTALYSQTNPFSLTQSINFILDSANLSQNIFLLLPSLFSRILHFTTQVT